MDDYYRPQYISPYGMIDPALRPPNNGQFILPCRAASPPSYRGHSFKAPIDKDEEHGPDRINLRAPIHDPRATQDNPRSVYPVLPFAPSGGFAQPFLIPGRHVPFAFGTHSAPASANSASQRSAKRAGGQLVGTPTKRARSSSTAPASDAPAASARAEQPGGWERSERLKARIARMKEWSKEQRRVDLDASR